MEVPSGPLVRSSYRADRVFEKNNLGLAAPAAIPGQEEPDNNRIPAFNVG
jgi:lipoic acid synthetase